MSQKQGITVWVSMDARTFRRFAVFDTLGRQKHWVSPTVFAVIFSVFALICFALESHHSQATLLGGVLFSIGLGLPLLYFVNFFISIHTQIKKYGLKKPKFVYSLTLNEEKGVTITTKQQKVKFPWDSFQYAYRMRDCIYLYLSANRAYLLPASQIPGGTKALWALLKRAISEQKLFDHSRLKATE